MKNIFKISLIIIATLTLFSSCETYKVKDPALSAVAPLDGRWICLAYDAADASLATPLEYFDIRISNTIDNDGNKMWMNICNFMNVYKAINKKYTDIVSVKVDCNPGALTFSASGAKSAYPTQQVKNYVFGALTNSYQAILGAKNFVPSTVSVNGTVALDGYDTPSGYKADKITFSYEVNGVKYNVVGHRYTGWEADYGYLNTFINEYMGW